MRRPAAWTPREARLWDALRDCTLDWLRALDRARHWQRRAQRLLAGAHIDEGNAMPTEAHDDAHDAHDAHPPLLETLAAVVGPALDRGWSLSVHLAGIYRRLEEEVYPPGTTWESIAADMAKHDALLMAWLRDPAQESVLRELVAWAGLAGVAACEAQTRLQGLGATLARRAGGEIQ